MKSAKGTRFFRAWSWTGITFDTSSTEPNLECCLTKRYLAFATMNPGIVFDVKLTSWHKVAMYRE
ncbi:MAG: hypothetical protein OXG15_12745 [Gammaproteobacteria bacterium]|nr:hypothetical protein [Gammaproteobacteria bacterium]